MSTLANRTDKKFLLAALRAIRELDRANIGDITKEDDAGLDDAMVVNEVFEATVEERLINPTFVLDYPAILCPLAKPGRKDPQYAERFELFVTGMELANAYTELNDPARQYENFRHQLRGQEESLTKMDMDYVTALKVGMPPTIRIHGILYPLEESSPLTRESRALSTARCRCSTIWRVC